ncbi:isoprenylcysteine carboxyl methyltransferase [Zobellella denitrificans]|jgi:protein-S-isoprenylcysteine O-methyltransferase Ste14|uniref:methyltransferase family protein n=1 Tax=Zobellella denitrificans TaxID=347534 RepID=UPI000B8C671C|nr:isoprenylcysteine carboxylmethyltransferase family protein [Zobellella denitrificans]OXS13695.1 isoprenylcysteine carboxyl methyltransferase [Zobellella denitrificans]
MDHSIPAYGLWGLVVLNSLVFILFAFSFFKPRSGRDWRTFGTFAAFIVALFVEMYGVPLTLFLLAGWLQGRYPQLDPLSHDAGHLWSTLFGLSGNPHFSLLHILSNILVFGGFLLLASAWRVLYRAQRQGQLAQSGPYARLRHPQYAAFVLIMAGFLLQWPTLLTLLMFPVLVVMYVRLARQEEQSTRDAFGAEWEAYRQRVPAFFPRLPGAGGPVAR